MNGVFAMPGSALHDASEPAARFREVAFTGQGPPRQRATKPGQDAAAHCAFSEGLNGERPAADADQQPRECQPLMGAIPAALLPDAGRCTMGGQVHFAMRRIVSHTKRDASLGTLLLLMGFVTRDVRLQTPPNAHRARVAMRFVGVSKKWNLFEGSWPHPNGMSVVSRGIPVAPMPDEPASK